MDANGTPFNSVLGEHDWRSWLEKTSAPGLVFDAGSRSLALATIVERFRTTASATMLQPSERRGADCDSFGTWYWIDRDRRHLRMRTCNGTRTLPFWSVDDLTRTPCPPKPDQNGEASFRAVAAPVPPWPDLELWGLAVTERHFLVVGTRNPAGLLFFDLHAGGTPAFEAWPAALNFEPFDITRAAGGGVWILDIGSPVRAARYWRLDAWLRPLALAGTIEVTPESQDQFGPAGGELATVPARTAPLGASIDGSPVAVQAARSIVALPDGSILLLDSPPSSASRIVRLWNGYEAGSVALDEALLGDAVEPPARVQAHDIAFVPGSVSEGAVEGRLYVVAVDGNQAFAFDLRADDDLTLVLRPEQLFLRRFSGMAIECCDGRPWYDLDDRFLPIVPHPRRRFVETATAAGLVFDGKRPDCRWRRLLLDACIPSGGSIDIATRAANEIGELSQVPWGPDEPAPYLRAEGSELPFHQPFSVIEQQAAGAGVWETALQAARGRFIELRLTLRGGGRLTPRIRSLRVYAPAFSYVDRYLPAVYREDPVSADFLDRYLANPEGLFTSLEGRIAAAEGLFDPRVTPEGYLDWLAGWLGGLLAPDWDLARRRLLLEYAELLFRWRGTPGGLIAMIRLAIDDCPSAEIFDDLLAGRLPTEGRFAGRSVRLVERFERRGYNGVSLGDATRPQQPGSAPGGPWTPALGSEPLHQRFASFLAGKYAPNKSPADALTLISAAWNVTPPLSSLSEIRLSPVRPSHPARRADWRDFLDRGLQFAYAEITSAHTAFYRESLARRWGSIGALNAAWGVTPPFASFDAISLPGEDQFPAAGQPLRDWIGFAALAVPVRDAAHRFTVLCPIRPAESLDERSRRLALVHAVVERERPSHTEFEIKPFWALFQVGTARLGLDTAIGEGARFTGIELGRTALGDGYLAFGHPLNAAGRSVLGSGTTSEISL